jgi:hypothetical protein
MFRPGLGHRDPAGQNPGVPVAQEFCVNKLAVIVMLVGLAACSRKKPEEGREPAQMAAPGAVVGSAAPAAPGGGAAPAAPSGAAGSAAAAADVGCAGATTLTCGADQIDGCASGLTAVHVCVAKDAKAGSPCAEQQALSCPAGQVDACLHVPPRATTHLCVGTPAP